MEGENNQDKIDFLTKIIEREELSGAQEGIAKQAIGKGLSSLSSKQEAILESFINEYRKKNECERCLNGNIGSLSDHIEVAEEGFCPTCQYDYEKLMAE